MGPLLLALGVIAVRMTTGLSFRESFRVFMTCLEDMMYEMVSMFTGLFDGPDDDQQNPA